MSSQRRFGLIGRGQIGGAVIDAWRSGRIPGWELCAVLVRSSRSVEAGAGASDTGGVPVVDDIDALLRSGCELVVEAAGAQAFAAHACRVLQVCDLWAVSPTALADPVLQAAVEATARRNGRRLRVLSGAIAGLDGVAMICVDDDAQLQLAIDLPPDADMPGDGAHRVVFSGTVRQAALRFPDAVNVAVAAALAGPGLDRARIEVLRPQPRDRHRLALRASSRYGNLEVAVHPRVAPGIHPVAACIVAALREASGAVGT